MDQYNSFNQADFCESGNKSMRYSFESERGGNFEDTIEKRRLMSPILSAEGNMLDGDGNFTMASTMM